MLGLDMASASGEASGRAVNLDNWLYQMKMRPQGSSEVHRESYVNG